MSVYDEFMAVATPSGDVIRRRAFRSVIGERGRNGLFDPITQLRPELEDGEVLLETIGSTMPTIIRARNPR
jgi:hypothetical protein